MKTAISPNTKLAPASTGSERFVAAGIHERKFYLVQRQDDGTYLINLGAGAFASLTGADQKIAIDPTLAGHVISKGSAILHRPQCYSLGAANG